MELTQHIENYKSTLNKTQQKQFDELHAYGSGRFLGTS